MTTAAARKCSHLFAVRQATLPIYINNSAKLFPIHRIYCVGRNYRDHAIEMGHKPNNDQEKEEPFFFQKPCDAAIHVNQSLPVSGEYNHKYHGISYPSMTNNLHYEAELVVAIGSEDFGENSNDIHSFTSHQDKLIVAENMIYGYAVGCDLTRRDLQSEAKKMSRPWDTSKGFDQSAPMKSILPKEHLGSLDNFSSMTELKLWINDELKQSSPLSDMIWSIPEIIVHLSRYFQLIQEDLIMNGTPAGVGTLRIGDQVRIQCCDILPECKFQWLHRIGK